MAAATLISIGRVIFSALLPDRRHPQFPTFPRAQGTCDQLWLAAAGAGGGRGFCDAIGGGLALIFGIWIVPDGIALIAFLVAATALYHNLFMFQGKERDPHLYLTLVNITLAGGLLMVIADAL